MSIIHPLDDRREIAFPGAASEMVQFCVDHFLNSANQAIDDHGYFAVALSGGSTPKAIFERLALPENRLKTDWSRFLVFWSDERSVLPSDPESNYRMAMDAGWSRLPISKDNIFRMEAEGDIEAHAKLYEDAVLTKIPQRHFDLVMLGMGDDGHTASLFPHTAGLHVDNRLVIANHIPQKNTWRMTLTFKCINASSQIAVYVMGSGKEKVLSEVLKGAYQPDVYPSQKAGISSHKALWIVDDAAATVLRGQ